MNILKNIASLLEEKSTPDPQPEKSVTTENPAPPERTLFDELMEKWVVGKTIVAVKDIFDGACCDPTHRAGTKGTILKCEPTEVRQEQGYHGKINREGRVLMAETTLGIIWLAYHSREKGYFCEDSDPWGPWKYRKWNESGIQDIEYVPEEEAGQYAEQIEKWNNPQLSFKIRRLEGRPILTVWFSHRAYTNGYIVVKQPSNNPVEFDSIEDARAAIEILKTRTNPLLIERFQRQFEDVEGEFYTVETITP